MKLPPGAGLPYTHPTGWTITDAGSVRLRLPVQSRGVIVRFLRLLIVVMVVAATAAPADAILNAFRICSREQVTKLNAKLTGRVLDYTANHGTDRRIWSPALGEKRDL